MNFQNALKANSHRIRFDAYACVARQKRIRMRRKVTQARRMAKLNTGSAACHLVAFRMLFNLALFRHTMNIAMATRSTLAILHK